MNNSMVFSYAARLRKMGNDYILSELGNAGLVDIVPSHGEILLYLLGAGTLRMGELTRKVRRTKSTVTVLVAKLARAGYVERRPDPAASRSDGLDNMLRQRLSDGELAELSSLLKKAVS